MAVSHEKVVKIENVSLYITGYKNDDTSSTSSAEELAELQRKTSIDTDSTTTESTLPSLPSKWPLIPQLYVRRYWDFSTSTDPSIKKATELLELLQTAIEDKSLATLEKESSRPPTSPEGKKILRFSVSPSSTVRTDYHDDLLGRTPGYEARSSTAPSQEPLSVQGVGALVPSTGQPSIETLPLPYLGADEVLEEVTALLAQLEKDRLETRVALEHEKNRSQMLAGKIDKLAQTRMLELPAAVQKEHEACAMDINELNWHVSYRSRILARIENKVNTAEALNTKVKEDISFVQKHCPLVEEKLDLEKTAMNRIRTAQQETNDELANTVERCAKTENKSEEAFSKAEAERTHIKNDLGAVNRDLTIAKEELARAKATHQSFIAQCENFKEKLETNHQELSLLEIECENAKVREAKQEARIKDYETRIIEEKWEKKRVCEDNIMKEAALEKLIRNNASEEETLNLKIKENEISLRKLTRSNQEYELDIEDFKIKIKQCATQEIADQKNLARMDKEMDRTEDQISSTEEQLSRVRIINSAFHKKLQNEKDKYTKEEEKLMATTAELQRTVESEKHRKTVLQARIISGQKSHEDDLNIAKQEESRARKNNTLAEKQMQAILEKVKVQRERHAKQMQTIAMLETQLKEALAIQKSLEEEFEQAKNLLVPELTKKMELREKFKKELEGIKWKINNMQQNAKDMTAFQSRMEKTITKTKIDINNLQDELDELRIQINTKQHIINETKSQLDQVNARYRDLEKRHKEHIKERKIAFEETKEEYSHNIKLNKELAANYREIQNQCIVLQNQVLDQYNRCLTLEQHLKDLKQVKGLQLKLHHALLGYYKLRGLYNTFELGRVSFETNNNASKVGQLKTSMDHALAGIKDFLSNDMNANKTMPTVVPSPPTIPSTMHSSQKILTAAQ